MLNIFENENSSLKLFILKLKNLKYNNITSSLTESFMK